jgi:urate oxidase
MSVRLGEHRYGEFDIRVLKLTRRGDRHELRDLTVDVSFEGDFAASHTDGDNTRILPTHTMRNTVYALARDHAAGDIEKFALAVSLHFVEQNAAPLTVRVDVAEQPWARVAIGGRPHESSFARSGSERRTTHIRRSAGDLAVEAGLQGIRLVKTRDATFEGFIRDRFTTLPESADRILATELTARWRYGWSEVPFGPQWQQVRQTLLQAFAEHDSRSLQNTLYAMAHAVLEQCPPVSEIRVSMAAFHPHLVDLAPFSMENTEVYVPGEVPFAEVEAVVRRDVLGD